MLALCSQEELNDAAAAARRALDRLVMTEPQVERRIAAILAADMVGFSRLMARDEEATLAALNACRTLIEKVVAHHRGRVFGSAGDSAVAEFPSAVQAVRAALEIQEAIAQVNAGRPRAKWVEYRIGVNLGDVMVDRDNLLGDGVNVAARLEALAEPGGLLISGSAYDQIEGKLDRFEFVGRRTLRNFDRSIRVYRWRRLEAASAWWTAPLRFAKRPRSRLAIGVALALLAAGSIAWWSPPGSRGLPLGRFPIQSGQVLPERPSIAVLPFTELGEDPDLDRFADGLLDNVITGLSRFPQLFVVASSSSLAYKGQHPDLRQVGRELGVRYVLEGSIGKEDGRLRLHAQLIDAATGYHVWAERYDRQWTDFFAVQDELTERIVGSLGGTDSAIAAADQERARHKPTASLDAYDYALRAADYYDQFTKDANLQARAAALQAIAIDPRFALAHAYVAWTYMAEFWWSWSDQPDQSVAQALDWARKAVAADPQEYNAHWVLGDAYQAKGEAQRALAAYEKALSLNPNDPELLQDYGAWLLPAAGRAADGIVFVKKAMRLNPRHPERYFGNLALNYYLVGRYGDAIDMVRKMSAPRMDHRLYLAASYAQLGRLPDAATEIATVLQERPEMTIERFLATLPFQKASDRERMRAGLALAGLPPEAPGDGHLSKDIDGDPATVR
jgi:adenylate cyclase